MCFVFQASQNKTLSLVRLQEVVFPFQAVSAVTRPARSKWRRPHSNWVCRGTNHPPPPPPLGRSRQSQAGKSWGPSRTPSRGVEAHPRQTYFFKCLHSALLKPINSRGEFSLLSKKPISIHTFRGIHYNCLCVVGNIDKTRQNPVRKPCCWVRKLPVPVIVTIFIV